MHETDADDDDDWECVSVNFTSMMQPRVKDEVTCERSMMLLPFDLDGSLGGKDFGTDTLMEGAVARRA